MLAGMCGIAGVLRIHPPGAPPPPPDAAIPEAWLDILDDSIKHRGPDGQGRFRDRAIRPDGTVVDVALVHRRLAIIDPATGHQPMVSRRGRTADEGLVAVVFNGCIYNHRELRKELQAAGHRFETDHSDTEVLIHAYREWGDSFPSRFDGMFAFALWDRTKLRLLLARDRAGEKPIYFSNDPTAGTAFASCVSGLARFAYGVGARSPKVDDGLVAHWIAFGFEESWPSWGIDQVDGGSSRVFDGDVHVTPGVAYYNADTVEERYARARTGGKLGPARIDALLRESVRSRLVADVPLGCFLSGGVDSSLLAHYAQAELAAAGSRLATYTVRMPEPGYDESEFAQRAADHIGTAHTTLEIDAHPATDIVSLIHQLGLPFGDSSLLPTAWVSRAARQHVKVALSGDGGDELFCGYERHVADRWLRRFGRLLAALPASIFADRDPKSRSSKLARLARAARQGGYSQLLAIFQRDDLRELMGSSEPTSRVGTPHPEGYWFDRSCYLPGDLLRKTDTASMARALEARCPFLSRDLLDACGFASESELMPHGQRKGLLRQVARKYLPLEIVDRPKQGFAIPIGEWFRTDYGGMRTLLLDHLNSAEPWGPPSLGIDLNMKFVRQMLDEHMGTGMSGRVKRDHSQRLYMLLVLSIWAKWLGGLR
jgi:asparagine synthase (glutamine-hydrolysing)